MPAWHCQVAKAAEAAAREPLFVHVRVAHEEVVIGLQSLVRGVIGRRAAATVRRFDAEKAARTAASPAAHEPPDVVAGVTLGGSPEPRETAAPQLTGARGGGGGEGGGMAGQKAKKRPRAKKKPQAKKSRTAGRKRSGFVNQPRDEYSKERGRRLVMGNKRSCLQDMFIHGAQALDVHATKASVYAATLPDEGDTAVGAIVQYATTLGIDMTCISADLRVVGGPELAVLQPTSGVFCVLLKVYVAGQPTDDHAVLLDAGSPWTRGPAHGVGAVIDNCSDVPIKLVKDEDRSTKKAARALFDSLFVGADTVTVEGAWTMERMG